jgi:putative transposon-encoded protein
MKIVKTITKSVLTLRGIKCFLEREVKPFGTSGRIDFPKEFIGKKVYVIIANESR